MHTILLNSTLADKGLDFIFVCIISFIHFHGWMLVRMKRAAGHTAGSDLEPIKNSGLSGRNSRLHVGKDIQNTPRAS